eukprot:Pompholyxophrys_punicea_v1_NODE_839_length_1224_cov_3.271172.p2 type:complete len:104 gc:universal NODE_839_length_1224_cov_3.271172:451-140(-)
MVKKNFKKTSPRKLQSRVLFVKSNSTPPAFILARNLFFLENQVHFQKGISTNQRILPLPKIRILAKFEFWKGVSALCSTPVTSNRKNIFAKILPMTKRCSNAP